MGLIKNSDEIKKMKKACKLIAKVHEKILNTEVVGMTEIEVAQKLTLLINSMNCYEYSFPMIVGSGQRSMILHAVPTDKVILKNELVLIDMGARVEGYCSDMTRTWSSSGAFTSEQKVIYDIVLSAQNSVLNSISEHESLASLHEVSKQALRKGLDQTELRGKYDLDVIFPHKTSHWIGEMVHDDNLYVDDFGQPLRLQNGMCFTVEPGLYIQGTNTKYDGIGLRIEDVVLKTELSYQILTKV